MTPGLTIAVPRGALMNETLDRLDAIGVDTSEVRSNDRKLLFGDIGVVTMRPSDVPTYVEAGAADVGITGKDVLTEQPERDVYELLSPEVAGRVIFDLGLTRDLGYYTGAVFEVYDPALGQPLGGGGRYDELLARFGRPLPAVGFALGIDRLHIALAGEERAVQS